MNNNNKAIIFIGLSLMVSACGGNMQSNEGTPGDNSFNRILSFSYLEKECVVYVGEESELYYSNIYGGIETKKYIFSYEYHPDSYIDTDIDDDFMNELYNQATINIELINNHFNETITIYNHNDTLYFEETVINEKEENLEIVLIEKYINFTISYNRSYYHLSIPVKLDFLKQYGDQIQDFDNDTYISFSDFIQNYKIKIK